MTTKSDIVLTDGTVELTGDVSVKRRGDGAESVRVDSERGRVSIGNEVSGSLSLRDSSDEERVLIRAKNPDPASRLGGGSRPSRVTFSGPGLTDSGAEVLNDAAGSIDAANVTSGGIDLGYPWDADGVRVYIDGERGGIVLGGGDRDGTVSVRNRRGETVVRIDASKEDIRIGDLSVGEQVGKIESKADRDSLEELAAEVRELRSKVERLESRARTQR